VKKEVTTMMLVDCESCPVREHHCADCMVTALTRIPIPGLRAVDDPVAPDDSVPLDPAERRAASVLLAAGLVNRQEADRARAQLEPAAGRSRRFAG
jgi:hypothetical protein